SSTRASARDRRPGSLIQTTWKTSTAAQSSRRATNFFCGVRNLAYLLSAAAGSGLVRNVVVDGVTGLALDEVHQPHAEDHHHRNDGELNGLKNYIHIRTALLNSAPAWPGPASNLRAGSRSRCRRSRCRPRRSRPGTGPAAGEPGRR